MLVKDMYDRLALITAFPIYTNETDTPEINRFLLEMLSEALQNTIDNLYISNNVLQRNDMTIGADLAFRSLIPGSSDIIDSIFSGVMEATIIPL